MPSFPIACCHLPLRSRPKISSSSAVTFSQPLAHQLTGTPLGVTLHPSQIVQAAFAFLIFAFLLALTALYMILASQFNSFVQPGVIMLSAPLAFVGAFAARWLAGHIRVRGAQIWMRS